MLKKIVSIFRVEMEASGFYDTLLSVAYKIRRVQNIFIPRYLIRSVLHNNLLCNLYIVDDFFIAITNEFLLLSGIKVQERAQHITINKQ